MFRIKKALSLAKEIEIVPLGDVHNGNPNCRFDKFEEHVNYVAETPNCYAVLMGDLLECILPSDKRYSATDKYSSVDILKKQLKTALLPIEHKIITALTGNHEWKLAQSGYGDPIEWLCQEFNIPHGGFSCYIQLNCEPRSRLKPLIIYAHHGWSAGRKTGATINNVEGLAQHWSADVYLVGHSHKIAITRQVMNDYNGYRVLAFCSTGTFVETATYGTTGYAERAGYPPLRIGCVKIKWFPRRKGNNVFVSE